MNRRDNHPRPPSVDSRDSAEAVPPVALSPDDEPSISETEVESPISLRDQRIGETLVGRYKLDKLIGRGGMGRVYRATQLPLNRSVAVKILNPEFQKKDRQFVRRFFLEAATAARLTHPNTITVFDYGESDTGELFIAMEYLQGRPLSLVLSGEGPFETVRTLHIATQICRALREAHAKGIVHRDLKPGNILLMDEGEDIDVVKVLDFGLVKLFNAPDLDDGHPLSPDPSDGELTRAGMFLGSPKYMSPEQIQGVAVDPRTDIYSLGVLMYQMATGRAPFTGSTSVEVIYKHVNDPPPPLTTGGLDVPPELQAIILRCLAKRQDDRYSSMGALLVHLKDARRLLVPSTSEGESEVDIDLSELTNSLLTGGGPSVLARPADEVSRSPTAPELQFTGAPHADDTGSLMDSAPTATGGWRSWASAAALSVMIAVGCAMLWVGALHGPKLWRGSLADPSTVGSQASDKWRPLPPAALSTAVVRLQSEPDGAEVYTDGIRIGRTPFALEVPYTGKIVAREYLFTREGYEPVVQQVHVDGLEIQVNVLLSAIPPPLVDPTEPAEEKAPAKAASALRPQPTSVERREAPKKPASDNRPQPTGIKRREAPKKPAAPSKPSALPKPRKTSEPEDYKENPY